MTVFPFMPIVSAVEVVGSVTLSSSGPFVVPDGITSLRVTLGGGSGGQSGTATAVGSLESATGRSASGGSGASVYQSNLVVTPNETLYFTAGAYGGTGASQIKYGDGIQAVGQAGGNGGTATLTRGGSVLMSAGGGYGAGVSIAGTSGAGYAYSYDSAAGSPSSTGSGGVVTTGGSNGTCLIAWGP